MEFQNYTSPTYESSPDPPSGSIKVFSDMVHVFLGMVQPNSFPPDFLIPMIQSNFKNVDVKQILWYEAGYLACVIIGILFIVLMPLVGFFFCCCRCCCGNCGGRMYQKQSKNIKCKRNYHYIALFLVTTIILAGNVCMFVSNSNVTDAVNTTFYSFNGTVNNLNRFLMSIPKEIDFIINSSSLPVAKANASLLNIGPILGGKILATIGTSAYPTLTSISSLTNVLYSSAGLLVAMNASFISLYNTQQNLTSELSTVQKNIQDILNSPSCTGCSSLSTSDLTFDANFSTIPDFSSQYKLLSDLNDTDIPSVIQQANDTLNSIPQQVTNKTKSTVSDVQTQLVNITTEIKKITKDLKFTDSLKNISSMLNNVTSEVYRQKDNVQQYDHIRWIVGICLSCVVLLVVICNVFGFLFGAIGLKPNVDPTERSCLSNSGGDFFMAGAGFSFIFSWLLMIVVLVLFLVGGNMYTIVCKPWSNQQLFKLIDTPNLIPSFNISQLLGLNTTLNISNIYNDCQNNQPLWSTLHLDQIVPLAQYLNISKYENDINSTFNNMNISIDPITFITDNQKNLLKNISSSGIDTLNFTDITNQMRKNTTKTDFAAFAAKLRALAANNTNATIQASLNQQADNLIGINNKTKLFLLPEIATLNNTITNLQSTTSRIPASVANTLNGINSTQNFIDTQASLVVKSESRTFLDTVMGYFHSYIAWVDTTLRYNTARCGPIGKVANSTYVMACDYLVDSLNSYWFSLGWCTIFLLPSIILAVKLAKYYRRMKSSDVYEDGGQQMEMTSTSEQFLLPRVALKK